MKATNINGTTGHTCHCDNWLDHWKKISGETANLCTEKSCTEKAKVGAHVQKEGTTGNSWYIIPLCTNHNNQRGKTIDVVVGTTFVSANVANTCGK